MPTATLDVDPDVYLSVGRTFLDINDAVCDIVVGAADAANSAFGMAGVDSTGAEWARSYDAAASSLLRAGSTLVDALGAVGDRLSVSGTNHDDAEVASVPTGGAGPPAYSRAPGTGRAVGVVVSEPPSADGTPGDPPPGWWLIAHLVAYTWPAGHQDQLREVGTGWLTASLALSDQVDRLPGPIAELAGQASPEVPYAVATCTGLQTAMRTVADEFETVAHVCNGYANYLDQAHRDVIGELVELVAELAVIELAGAIAAAPTGGVAEVPAQAVAGSRLGVAVGRITTILKELAERLELLKTLVQGVTEHVVSALVDLQQVTAQRETLQAVTELIDAGIPTVDLQANDDANPSAHVVEKHVAKSDAYLIGRNIPRASTFTSLAAATTAISTVIAANRQDIAHWLAGTDAQTDIRGSLPPGAGRVYLRDSGTFVNATRFKVILRRNAHGYFIFTVVLEP